jgi:hypothetical protein
MEKLRISGKDLGALALPDFCERCFWIQRWAPSGLPYQIFPGIFSSIDSYSKNMVHSWFDRHGVPPPWLSTLGSVVSYRNPPHHSKFSFMDTTTNILLTGAPDAIFELLDESIMIADYKTAKFTETQDKLFPVYRTQLNAYAMISESIGYGHVSNLALIYTEPITDKAAAGADHVHNENGFNMGFSAHILSVDLDVGMIPPLLTRARDILNSSAPPIGNTNCKDCLRLEGVLHLMSKVSGG